ncbi:MAG: Gx transporter family protein [Clostridia bacterium]|nr:Gx transporter family protein [Clostridia bacterium]
MDREKRQRTVRRLAGLGILLALAFGLGYLDYLIPLDAVGVPGIKLGLANLAVLAALYLYGWREAALVSGVRILLFFFVFGNLTSFLFSLAGGLCSYLGMVLFRRVSLFDELGVSVIGAVLHNTGQMAAALFLLGSDGILWYYPVLLIAAVLSGSAIGLLFRTLNRRLLGRIGSRLGVSRAEGKKEDTDGEKDGDEKGS